MKYCLGLETGPSLNRERLTSPSNRSTNCFQEPIRQETPRVSTNATKSALKSGSARWISRITIEMLTLHSAERLDQEQMSRLTRDGYLADVGSE